MGYLKPEDRVERGPFIEFVQRETSRWHESAGEFGQSLSELALACDAQGGRGKGDTTWLKRKLGLSAESEIGRPSKHLSYGAAVRMVKSWALDPVDFGV